VKYSDLLLRGNVNEVTDALLDILEVELKDRKARDRGNPQQVVRDALKAMFERGRELERGLLLQRRTGT
jgi:hypothetical protein